MTFKRPCDTGPKEVIHRAKFDVCTSSSFGGVKVHVRTRVQTEMCFINVTPTSFTHCFKKRKF